MQVSNFTSKSILRKRIANLFISFFVFSTLSLFNELRAQECSAGPTADNSTSLEVNWDDRYLINGNCASQGIVRDGQTRYYNVEDFTLTGGTKFSTCTTGGTYLIANQPSDPSTQDSAFPDHCVASFQIYCDPAGSPTEPGYAGVCIECNGDNGSGASKECTDTENPICSNPGEVNASCGPAPCSNDLGQGPNACTDVNNPICNNPNTAAASCGQAPCGNNYGSGTNACTDINNPICTNPNTATASCGPAPTRSDCGTVTSVEESLANQVDDQFFDAAVMYKYAGTDIYPLGGYSLNTKYYLANNSELNTLISNNYSNFNAEQTACGDGGLFAFLKQESPLIGDGSSIVLYLACDIANTACNTPVTACQSNFGTGGAKDCPTEDNPICDLTTDPANPECKPALCRGDADSSFTNKCPADNPICSAKNTAAASCGKAVCSDDGLSGPECTGDNQTCQNSGTSTAQCVTGGCKDETALNYDSNVDVHDQSLCNFCGDGKVKLEDINANAQATQAYGNDMIDHPGSSNCQLPDEGYECNIQSELYEDTLFTYHSIGKYKDWVVLAHQYHDELLNGATLEDQCRNYRDFIQLNAETPYKDENGNIITGREAHPGIKINACAVGSDYELTEITKCRVFGPSYTDHTIQYDPMPNECP